MQDRPIWVLLQHCGQELTSAGRSPFTRGDLIACVQETRPSIGADSINPIIQGITDNLKGGAPGAVGKNILHNVGRGQLVLRADAPSADDSPVPPASIPNAGRTASDALPRSEADLRDAMLALLRPALPGVRLEPEGAIQYRVPSGRSMSHKSDILASRIGSVRQVSIEIKYRSAVTDQFKARAYDAAHMKREHGGAVLTALLYAKADTGISIDRARDICYEFDRFYGNAARTFLDPGGVDELALDIRQFLFEGDG